MSEFPHCTVCKAPVSLRATTCAVCDAPAPPVVRSVPSGEFRSGEWVRFQKPPEELRDLYADLSRALAPNIRVLGMAGEGGMALVFVGRDSVLKREVAVKLLSPVLADDPVARKRFTREAEAIAAVTNPNIVNVYHVGELQGRSIPYFVMQFVDGPTLGMGALRGRPLTEVRVRRLLADVAAGLAAAHRRKVYHRDIKPNNIVLDGETGRAMVLDFGISAASSSRRKSLGKRLTEEGMYLGTPTYMSPEQGAGEVVTGKTDVYSLGVVAFELLTGRPPFEGAPVAIMAAHMHERPPRIDDLRPDVSDELATLVARCLEKSPARRPSAEDIVNFLNPAGRLTVEWPPPGMSRVRGAGARLLTSMLATAVSVAAFFGVIVVWPQVAVLRHSDGDMAHSFVLGAGLALIFGLTTMVLLYALLAFEQWRMARAAGYPAWVIADVLNDMRRDTGSLINGTADFAFLPGTVRQHLLRLRRVRLVIQTLALLAALAGIARWVGVWLAAAGFLPQRAVASYWALPLLAAFLLYVFAGVPEWRVRRGERHRTGGRRSVENAPPIRGELVQMWMASAERARKSLSGDVAGKR